MPWYSKVLYPISAAWSGVLSLRHWLYDHGVFASHSSPVKTVVIGNLELGGTGKSQLTLFLIEQLKDRFNLAVLSRGYGRKTTGYYEVDLNSTANQVGDEPIMFKHRQPSVLVSVCENRLVGLKKIHHDHPEIDLVILDDAFQHRPLKPDMAIITTDLNSPYFKQQLLPVGRLRDVRSRAEKADILVVTGCSENMKEQEKENFVRSSGFWKNENVFFSTVKNEAPVAISPLEGNQPEKAWLLSGIARSERFAATAARSANVMGHTAHPDHHVFSENDLRNLRKKLDSFDPSEISVLMTEKDASRINVELLKKLLAPYSVFYLPIKMKVWHSSVLIKKLIENVLEEDK